LVWDHCRFVQNRSSDKAILEAVTMFTFTEDWEDVWIGHVQVTNAGMLVTDWTVGPKRVPMTSYIHFMMFWRLLFHRVNDWPMTSLDDTDWAIGYFYCRSFEFNGWAERKSKSATTLLSFSCGSYNMGEPTLTLQPKWTSGYKRDLLPEK